MLPPYADAKALSQRRRAAGQGISNRSLLEEVRDRDSTIQRLRQEQQQQKIAALQAAQPSVPEIAIAVRCSLPPTQSLSELKPAKPRKPVSDVLVYDLEELRRGAGRW